jgi:hypothetical protein
MGYVLGITGNIGSGKSTLAAFLCDQEPSHARYETSELVAEVAEDFNRALSGELAFETTTDDIELVNQALIWFIESISEKRHRDVPWSQLAVTKHAIASRPELFEKLFIYVGASKKEPQLLDARITSDNKDSYRALLQWLGGYLVARIGDSIWYDELFRRVNLYDADKSLVVISGVRYPSDAQCVRDNGGIIIGVDRPQLESDTTDVTERGRSDITPDTIIINDGSLEQLQTTTEQLWFDIGAGKVKPTYKTLL